MEGKNKTTKKQQDYLVDFNELSSERNKNPKFKSVKVKNYAYEDEYFSKEAGFDFERNEQDYLTIKAQTLVRNSYSQKNYLRVLREISNCDQSLIIAVFQIVIY